MALADRAARSAAQVIRKTGKRLILEKQDKGYTPDLGKPTGTKVQTPFYGQLTVFEMKTAQRFTPVGETVAQGGVSWLPGDFSCVADAVQFEPDSIPEPNDVVIDGTTTFKLVWVYPTYSGEQVALYELQLRS